jgi:hypothetical protein
MTPASFFYPGGIFMGVIRLIFFFGPLIFAFGFIAPLLAQIIRLSGVTPPYDLTPLSAGLLIAGLLGAVAQWRGRWI